MSRTKTNLPLNERTTANERATPNERSTPNERATPNERTTARRKKPAPVARTPVDASEKAAPLSAFRHGAAGRTLILPVPELQEFLNLTEDLHAELGPKGLLEIMLVESIANNHWSLYRYRTLEHSFYSLDPAEAARRFPNEQPEVQKALAMAYAARQNAQAINQTGILQCRLETRLLKNYKELSRLQAERHVRELTGQIAGPPPASPRPKMRLP